MSKKTDLNRKLWERKDERLWCFTCGKFVKPKANTVKNIEECPNCREKLR